MAKLLASEKRSETFQSMGAHLLCQTPSLNGLNLGPPYSESSHPTSLDRLDTHLAIPRPHLTKQPISSYLYYLKEVASDHIAYSWGINTVFALVILNNINPSVSADHQNTILTLVNRFRLATQALIKAEHHKKLSQYDKLYLWLWEQLPAESTSLVAFIQRLTELEKSGSLTTFQFNLIRDIRRAYSYVLHSSPKKLGHQNSTQKRFEHYALEDSDMLLVVQELPSSTPIRSRQYEELSDHQEVQHVQIDTEAVSPLCKQSKFVQQQSVKLMQQHIVRLQHRFRTSSHYPDLESIRLLLAHCWNQYSTAQYKNKAYLIILLSVLTGNSTDEWLKVQSPKNSRLNQRQRLISLDDRYFLRSKFTLFDPVHFPHKDALHNQITHFDLPLANNFVQGLKAGPVLEQSHIRSALQQCREELYIPSLTSKKLSTLLHASIYHMTGNMQLADILTGIDANRSCSISYCSYPVYRLQSQYLETVQNLTAEMSKPFHLDQKSHNFGSLKAPMPSTVTSIFAYLYAQVIQSKHRFDVIATYNHYNIWLWHILLLFTAARPVKDFPGLLIDFDLNQGWLWVADKEIHGRRDDGRILPLCVFLQNELKCYLKYLRKNAASIDAHIENSSQHIHEIFESKKPLLGVFLDNQWQSLSPALVAQFTENMQLDHANWLRHTTRAFLTDKTEESLILALFGHEKNQQEMGNQYSSLPLNTYRTLANTLDDMKDFFQLDGMGDDADKC